LAIKRMPEKPGPFISAALPAIRLVQMPLNVAA